MITVNATKAQLTEIFSKRHLVSYGLVEGVKLCSFGAEGFVSFGCTNKGHYYTLPNGDCINYTYSYGRYAEFTPLSIVKCRLLMHISNMIKGCSNAFNVILANMKYQHVEFSTFEFLFVDISVAFCTCDLIVKPRNGMDEFVTIDTGGFSYWDEDANAILFLKCITEFERIMGIDIETWDGSDA